MPAGWRVQRDGSGDIAVSDPQGRAAALVRTRRVPPQVELARWLHRHYAAQVFRGRASVVAVRHGDQATLFVAAASRTQFAQVLPELTRILGSVRCAAADAPVGTLDLAQLLCIGTEVPDR